MGDTTQERIRDGYYCLIIAILKGCPMEKAQALYEGRAVWVTPDLVDEMVTLYQTMPVSQIAEIYSMKPQQVRVYLHKAGVFVSSRKQRK